MGEKKKKRRKEVLRIVLLMELDLRLEFDVGFSS